MATPSALDPLTKEMIYTAVSVANGCGYCVHSHSAAARAKGMSDAAVMVRHVLRNSLIPVVTYLGQDLGALMGGAIVTEGIFGINGVGGMLWQGIIRGEPSSVVSVTTALVLVYIVANLLVDLLYAVLDPRIRYA